MKKTILLSLIILSFIGCEQKSDIELEYERLYRNNIRERNTTLNKLGEWEYSQNNQDSIWNKTDATHNLNLIENVLAELEPIEREWDSLVFLSRKYDSIPLPSEEVMKFIERPQERKLWIMKWKITLEETVEKGLYTRDGKEIK